MKHLYKLSEAALDEFLNNPSTVYEKIDGSFIKVGRDETGKVYTQRKDAHRHYDVSTWSTGIWASNFRHAHVALIQFLEGHEAQHGVLENSTSIHFEIIDIGVTNVVNYRVQKPTLVATNRVVTPTTITSKTPVLSTTDGQSCIIVNNEVVWDIINLDALPIDVTAFKNTIRDYLNGDYTFNGRRFTVREVLFANLTKKPIPDFPNWKSVLKELRESERRTFQKLVEDAGQKLIMQNCKSMIEGLVFQTGEMKAKIFDKDFSKVLRLSRVIPNVLYRKSRSEPLTEKSLGKLLHRYNKKRLNTYVNVRGEDYFFFSDYSVHSKVLGRFADLRKGIIDGR